MDPVNVPAEFEVVDFGTNRKGVCDFLGPILHRFGDIAGFFALPSDPTAILPQFWWCSRCTRWPMLGSARAEPLGYSAVKLFSKYSNLCENIPQRHGRTDGQTANLLWHNRASRGKN